MLYDKQDKIHNIGDFVWDTYQEIKCFVREHFALEVV